MDAAVRRIVGDEDCHPPQHEAKHVTGQSIDGDLLLIEVVVVGRCVSVRNSVGPFLVIIYIVNKFKEDDDPADDTTSN